MLGHCADIGRDVVVQYRWHPLFGRRVRCHYGEKRAGGEVVHLEVAPGVVTTLPAWMLDPLACAGMELGSPRVTIDALNELHALLVATGFRRGSLDDVSIVREGHDEAAVAKADVGAATTGPG
ncbi:MAG: hypothetical protein EA356_03875, partial [Geminicoccaceae bacterium]